MKIEIKNLHFRYSGKEKDCLTGFDLKIEGKEKIVALMGANGSGKTTLLKLLAGLIEPRKGEVMYDIGSSEPEIGLSPEDPELGFFEETVEGEAEFYPKNLGLDHRSMARRTLKEMGVYHLKERDPYLLSSGQQRLVSIASVLSGDPDVVLLDEPVHSLHRKGEEKIGKVLKKTDKPTILATHSSDFAYKFADEIVILHEGNVLTSGKPSSVLSQEDLLKKAGVRMPGLVRWSKARSSNSIPASIEEAVEMKRKMEDKG